MNTQRRTRRPFFKHYKMILANEFRGYNGASLVKDVLAGITVGAVALPLALAFGAASVDAGHAVFGISAGIITAIIAGVTTGLLGGGSFQISGPTGAMTVILTSIVVGTYGLNGMFLACMLAGVIMLIAGLLRFGKLVQFIPRPVVTGFTSGIAIIIALGQLGNFFGVSLSGENTVAKVIYFFRSAMGSINIQATICSLVVVLIMAIYPKKWGRVVPGSLIAIIIVTVAAQVMHLDVATIGKIPTSVINSERLMISAVTPEMLRAVSGYAVTIAALGMIESLLCGTCAANMKKEKFDSNVEMIAQGIGNIIIPFFGGVPSTAAIARTSVAINSGGKTRLTSLFQSIFLLACMFLFSGVIGYVPYAALAGVLAVTAFRMNEWHSIGSYFKNKLDDAVAMFLITMIATVFLDLTYAILIGVAFSMLMLVVRLSAIELEDSPVSLDGEREDAVIIYTTGALFFANSKELPKFVERQQGDYQHYIFSLRGIIYVDVSAVDTLSELVKSLREKGCAVSVTGASDSVERILDRTGFSQLVGKENMYSSIDRILSEKATVPSEKKAESLV